MARAPRGYVQLKGSERRPAPGSKLVGPADPNEISESIVSFAAVDGRRCPITTITPRRRPVKRLCR